MSGYTFIRKDRNKYGRGITFYINDELPGRYLINSGDFNMTTSNPFLSQFLDMLALSPLNIDPTCFKNSKNQNCIDLLLTNFKPSFMKTNVFETGISNHHKRISTIIKLLSQGEVLKQNTIETTVSLISVTLVLIQPFPLSKEMKTVKD